MLGRAQERWLLLQDDHVRETYVAQVLDVPAYIEVTGISRRECVAELRRVTGDDVALTIEVVPDVVGVAEAEGCAVSGVQPTRESMLPYFGTVGGRRAACRQAGRGNLGVARAGARGNTRHPTPIPSAGERRCATKSSKPIFRPTGKR